MKKWEKNFSLPAWSDFYARSRFARSTIPEEKWGLLVVYLHSFDQNILTFENSYNSKP